MKDSLLIQNVTVEELTEMLRSTIREEINTNRVIPEPSEEKNLTRKETAKLLRISLPTLNSYTKNGLLKAYTIGNRVLYSEKDIKTSVKEMPHRTLRNNRR